MDTPDHYPDARAALSAIKQGAHAHSEQTGIHVAQAVALAYMDRFLSRIFGSSGAESWMLKGGTSMLARISNARSTRDLDLTHCAADLRVALQELKDLAGRDLGDHFQFVFHSAEAISKSRGLTDHTGYELASRLTPERNLLAKCPLTLRPAPRPQET